MAAELFIGKLPPSTNERDLIKLFSSGTVRGVRIPSDKDGRQRGHAFVGLASLEDAEAAISRLNGYVLNGRRITVRLSQRQETEFAAGAPKQSSPTHTPRRHPPATPQDYHRNRASTGPPTREANSLSDYRGSHQHGAVFLCDRESLPRSLGYCEDTTHAPTAPQGDYDSVRSIVPKIVAPLAAYVEHLTALQQQSVISHSAMRSEIERIARFFVHVFYSAITREGEIPDESRRNLADYFWTASAGQAARLASGLSLLAGKHKYHFLQRGAHWWLSKQRLLLETIQLCNDAIHSTASQFDEQMRLRLPDLNAALVQLDELGWVLFCSPPGSPKIMLNGATHGEWARYEGEIPTENISLNPLLIFRNIENRLDVFQNRVGNRSRGYNLIRLGDHLPPGKDFAKITADNDLASAIEKCCPFDEWKREFEVLDHWKIESEGTWTSGRYDFSDLAHEAAQRLYGRDDDLESLKSAITRLHAGKSGAVLVLGPQGVGKSALMWKLLDHFRPIHAVVPFFFRDRDPRCHLEIVFQAAAIAIARHKGIALHTESAQARFREAVSAKPRSKKSPERPLLFLDGLDALSESGSDDLPKLLELMESAFKDSVSWVCASQPLPELLAFARTHQNVTVFEVPLLKLEARRDFLRSELQVNATDLSAFDLWGLMSDDFVDRVVSQSDAGLPFYLRAVLDSAIRLGYRNPDEIPPTVVETWQQTIRRLQHDMVAINLVALLSMVLVPLTVVEIEQVVSGLDATQIEVILRRHPCFTELATGWSITWPAFGRYIRETSAADIRALRSQANRNLVTWASGWRDHKSRYALEFLPRHLENEPEALRRLAFDNDFLAAQTEQFPKRPELPRDTIYRALLAIKRSGLLEGTLLLALRHAEYVSLVSRTATLADEFRKGNYVYVSHLAVHLDEEQEQILWKLLAVAGSIYSNDRDAAQEIAAQIRLPEYRRGSQRKYEVPAAVLLGIVATASSESEIDLHTVTTNTVATMLSGRGTKVFFESLGKAREVVEYAHLLPPSEKPRMHAVNAIARALGQQHVLSELSKLLAAEPFQDEIRLEGAAGLVASGDFESATRFALPIKRDNYRRSALSSIAAALAFQGGSTSDIDHSVLMIQAFWDVATDDDKQAFINSNDRDADQCAKLLSAIGRRALDIDEVFSAALITSQLGIIQWKLMGDESLLRDAESRALDAGTHRDWTLLELCRAYTGLNRWDDVERVRNQMSGPMQLYAHTEILAAKIPDSTNLAEYVKDQKLSIRAGCALASRLSRTGLVECATHVILESLLGLHSMKADQPSLWGKPRVLGELAAMLHCVGETDLGETYFEMAQQNLKNLSRHEWQTDRIFALIDLADAASSAIEDPTIAEVIIERIDFCLSEARRAAMKLRRSKQLRPEKFADILGRIWEIRYRFNIGEPGADLDEAFKAAREELNRKWQVSALVEIARHQAKCGNKADSYETLRRAQQAAGGGGVYKAIVLLGRAQCGDIDGLEIEIENSLTVLHDGDVRHVICRAEVERCLQVQNLKAADYALEKIVDVSVRSHAARSIARKHAELGDFHQALLTAQDKIVAGRSDLIPDVAEAIAGYARTNPLSRADARVTLLDLLLETAPYLDGTYRSIGAIIRSRAFELNGATLQDLARSLVLGHTSEEEHGTVAQ